MIICHLSSAHGQEDTRIFHKECVSLAKAGYTVYEITAGSTYDKNGVHITGITAAGSGRLKRMFGTTRNVYKKALEINADVYHAHDPELLPTLMKLRRKGKKVIFDSHEHTAGAIEEKTYIPMPLRKLIRFAYESYQTYVCRRMDAVITATPNITRYFQRVGCKRVIDLCNFPILSGNFTEPDYGTKTLSFAGNISRQWNHEKIINALSCNPQVRYVLAGIADDDYLNELKGLPCWEQVDFKGRLPFEEVSEVLRHTSVGMSILTPGANTDWHKGNMANTKIFEEMMAGLPVICTDFARWKKFVTKFDCGICVDPQDQEQITEAVKMLTSDPGLARRKGLNGRKAVERVFNWGVEEKKLIALYQTIETEIGEK